MREEITTNSTDRKRIMEYSEQLYASKFGNFHKREKLLGRHKIPKLIQEETDNLIALYLLNKLNV